MNTKVEESLGVLRHFNAGFTAPSEAVHTLAAHIAQQEKMLADCFRAAGADSDGDEDWRIADRAYQAVCDLREDYNEAGEVIAQQDATIARLREALEAACESVERWGAYASPYFTPKRNTT